MDFPGTPKNFERLLVLSWGEMEASQPIVFLCHNIDLVSGD